METRPYRKERDWGDCCVNEEYDICVDDTLRNAGIDNEILAKDLKNGLTLDGAYSYCESAELPLNNPNTLVTVVAEENLKDKYKSKLSIIEYLNQIPFDQFKEVWENTEQQAIIVGMIRYPSGLHEWLMVACLPMLKEMGIPMELVKECRTPTTKCTFYYEKEDEKKDEKKDEEDEEDNKCGCHGGLGSTTMHNDLYRAIEGAYIEWKRSNEYEEPLAALKRHLSEFASKYYPDMEKPQGLAKLISG